MIKNGKLFGKLNIIDFLVILVIVLAAIFILYTLFGSSDTGTDTTTIRITFYQEECADYVIAQTHVGDAMMDDTTEGSLGTVVDVQTDTAASYSTLEDGTVVKTPKEDYSSVYITGEVQGVLTDNGAVISGTLYSVGHTTVLHAGYGKYYLQVYSIEEVG